MVHLFPLRTMGDFSSLDSALRDYIIECPWLLKSPIVRNGSKCTIGYQPETWDAWAKEG